MRVLVGVEQERVGARPGEVDLVAVLNGARRPVFCSKTISSWSHGMRDEVLGAHADEADVGDPPAVSTFAPSWSSSPTGLAKIFSGPDARASPCRPWAWHAVAVDADLLALAVDHDVAPEVSMTSAMIRLDWPRKLATNVVPGFS